MGTFGKIAIIILPWMLVIGLMTYISQGQFYAPSGEALMETMATFPVTAMIENWKNLMMNTKENIVTSWANIDDFFSFFEAIGSFFNAMGASISIFFQLIALPIMVIYWLINEIFAGTNIPVEETSSSVTSLISMLMP